MMYKVIKDYIPQEGDLVEYLRVEKDDILIDCESVDERWLRGKHLMNENFGKIPIDHVELFSCYDKCDGIKINALARSDDNIQGALTENPLLDVVDKLLEDEEVGKTSKLSKYHESSNYVEMSSGETLNDISGSVPDILVPQQAVKDEFVDPLRKPHRRAYDSAKTSDEGYNSGSHYSGENPDSNMPLLSKAKPSKQDEAGYEVPHVVCDIKNHSEKSAEPQNDNKTKKRSLLTLWTNKSREENMLRRNSSDETREKYYDPPVDFRDNYLLPLSSYPVIRMILSFIAALILAVALFLVLLLLAGIHPVLCFSLSVILFTMILVTPVTLLHRGVFCVTSLILPSLVSTRVRVGLVILLVALLILGPVFGIADQLKLATSCAERWHRNQHETKNDDGSFNSIIKRNSLVLSRMEDECISSFTRVNRFCVRSYDRFRTICEDELKRSTVTDADKIMCTKPLGQFCVTNNTVTSQCSALSTGRPVYNYEKELKITKYFRNILMYFLPLLTLLLLSEAYSYNKIYLTTKNTENIYVTTRLRELDCERKDRGLTDLILPLTRIEFQTYLVRRAWALSKSEKERLVKWLLVFFIFTFVTVTFVLLEEYIHKALLVTQMLQCKRDYEIHSQIHYRLHIYVSLGILLFVILVSNYVLRLRSIICECFYPDMVDIRSKHLYYKILHDRHTFARHVRRKIQLLSEEKRLARRISFKWRIYEVLPTHLQTLFKYLSVQKCMICDSLSFYKTEECKERTCRAHYCYECFVDAGQSCLTCKTSNSSTNSIAV